MKKLSLVVTLIAVVISSRQNTLNVGENVKPRPLRTVVEQVAAPTIELTSLGEFKLTAYCSCVKCCGNWAKSRPVDEYGNEIVIGASGERLTAGYSVAVDPKVIPYGTELLINDQTYKAQDCGGAIDGNEIDVYFSDHTDALEFGVQYAEIFIREE